MNKGTYSVVFAGLAMGGRASWSWEDWGRKADALHRRKRWREALECFNGALRRNPLDTASRDAYASDLAGKIDCLVRLGRFAAALRSMEELKEFKRGLRGRKSPRRAKKRHSS